MVSAGAFNYCPWLVFWRMKTYFATVAPSLEAIAARELEQLGAQNVQPQFSGVSFQGDQSLLYRVNLWARTIYRVLVPLQEIKSYNAQQLYKSVSKIDWSEYFSPAQTFAVNCTGGNQQLNHTHFSALQIKNAIVDQQRAQWGKRSSIDLKNPAFVIHAHIHEHKTIIYLDSSGESLHRRGYRPAVGLAPLKETLAAALLAIAEWQSQQPFFDPLCGSGTLPLEAAFQSLNIAPGLYRTSFCFQNWPDFKPTLWQELLTEAKNKRLSQLQAPIIGSDGAAEMIAQAVDNAHSCGLSNHLQFSQKHLDQIEPIGNAGVIICNPPYGKRLGNPQELGALYKQLGDIFKQRFKGWTAYVLTGNRELAKQIGLRSSRRFPVYNGTIPCTLLKYEMY